MEEEDPITIATIIGLGISGVGLGENIANRPGNPKPPPPTPAGPTAIQLQAQSNAEKAAVSQQTPNVLAETSGLANPEYIAQMAQLLAGTAGQPGSTGAAKSAVASAFGLPGGGVPGVQNTSTSNFKPAGTDANPNPGAAGPTNLSDFVTQFLYK